MIMVTQMEFRRVATFSTCFITRLMALVDTDEAWTDVKVRAHTPALRARTHTHTHTTHHTPHTPVPAPTLHPRPFRLPFSISQTLITLILSSSSTFCRILRFPTLVRPLLGLLVLGSWRWALGSWLHVSSFVSVNPVPRVLTPQFSPNTLCADSAGKVEAFVARDETRRLHLGPPRHRSLARRV
jgi:hypothetical protein